MLQSLTDMKIASKFIDAQDHSSEVDVLDQNYKKLKCKIEAVPSSSEEYKIIHQYVENTKGSVKV